MKVAIGLIGLEFKAEGILNFLTGRLTKQYCFLKIQSILLHSIMFHFINIYNLSGHTIKYLKSWFALRTCKHAQFLEIWEFHSKYFDNLKVKIKFPSSRAPCCNFLGSNTEGWYHFLLWHFINILFYPVAKIFLEELLSKCLTLLIFLSPSKGSQGNAICW